MKKTTRALRKEDCQPKWHLIDATDVPLGRLAVKVCNLLRGKEKPNFTPHVECGDFVVVINAEKVKLTGKKEIQKKYYSHSWYPGGLKVTSFARMKEKHPTKIVYEAVRGMLPTNRLSNKLLTKIKIYAGPNYKEKAQKPQVLELAAKP